MTTILQTAPCGCRVVRDAGGRGVHIEQCDDHGRQSINIRRAVICLMNLRSQIGAGHTSIVDEAEKRGADRALTMAIVKFGVLLDTEPQP